ncbi:hypothetical protein T439DRAFT_357999 [Meredithblackwellia eburnea MCA 4105]
MPSSNGPPPPPPGAAGPSSSSSSPATIHQNSPPSSPTTSRRKSTRSRPREVVVVPKLDASASTSSPPLSTGVGPLEAAVGGGGTKKLTKWLTSSSASSSTSSVTGGRGRAKSVGSGSMLDQVIRDGQAQGVGISISPSSSLGSVSAAARPGSRRGSAGSPVLLNQGLPQPAVPPPEVVVRGDDEGKQKGGFFGLRRTKSSLRMFGGGGGNGGTAALGGSGAPPARDVDSATLSGSFEDDLRSSTSSFHQLPHSASFNNGTGQNPNVANRIGGWFTSMLHSSASTSHLPLPATNSDPTLPQSPTTSRFSTGSGSFSTPATLRLPSSSPSKSSSGSGGGRLGPLDRMLDKAVQYFLDTDSQADKCEEDIWVLGVRHDGYREELSLALSQTQGGSGLGVGVDLPSADNLSGGNGGKKRRSVPTSTVLSRAKKGGKKRGTSVDLTRSPSLTPSHEGGGGSPSTPSTSPPSSVSMSPQSSRGSNSTSTAPPLPLPLPPQPPVQTYGWPTSFYHDFYSRIGLTYRTGFPPIPCSPSSGGGLFNQLSMSIGRGSSGRTSEGLSSDSGWGCMLRTGQSLLANALISVHLGRDWRRPLPPVPTPTTNGQGQTPHFSVPPPTPLSPSHATYTRIISLFLDDPSPLAPFSVHRFALMGKQLGKEVGEWFGPSTAAGAIKALVSEYEPAGLAVSSFVDGTVYKSEVVEAAGGEDGEWQKPVLVLINLRLGIDGVNPIYHEAVKAIFSFPQSVGIAGGRPSSSYYFVGTQANSLFYIDPHHPKTSIPIRTAPSELVTPLQTEPLARTESRTSSTSASIEQDLEDQLHTAPSSPPNHNTISDSFVTVVPSPTTPNPISHPATEQSPSHSPTRAPVLASQPSPPIASYLLDAYPDSVLRTYHTEKVRKMALQSMDPSMLLGFLIRDESDWEDFCSRVKEVSQLHKSIFAIADSPPAWMRKSMGASVTGNGGGGGLSSAEESDGIGSFSEPDDWELDSGNASASSPPHRPVSDDDDEWETTSPVPTRSLPPSISNQTSGGGIGQTVESWTKVPELGSTTRTTSTIGAFAAAPSDSPKQRATALEDDGVVVVEPSPTSTGPIGGTPVLVSPLAIRAAGAEKVEEGWEGVADGGGASVSARAAMEESGRLPPSRDGSNLEGEEGSGNDDTAESFKLVESTVPHGIAI